jgi:hypothetical protein
MTPTIDTLDGQTFTISLAGESHTVSRDDLRTFIETATILLAATRDPFIPALLERTRQKLREHQESRV